MQRACPGTERHAFHAPPVSPTSQSFRRSIWTAPAICSPGSGRRARSSFSFNAWPHGRSTISPLAASFFGDSMPIDGVALPEARLAARPSFPLASLSDEGAASFLRVFAWFVHCVRSGELLRG
jgi:hypothetical protein